MEQEQTSKPNLYPDGIRWYEFRVVVQLSGDQEQKYDRSAVWEIYAKTKGHKLLAEGRAEDQYQAMYEAIEWLNNTQTGLILQEVGQTIDEAFKPESCAFAEGEMFADIFPCTAHGTGKKHCWNCGEVFRAEVAKRGTETYINDDNVKGDSDV